MKRKAVIGILCAALILTLALGVLAACNDDNNDATCTISFFNGDETVKTLDVVHGYKLRAYDIPEAPVYEGKQFKGWYVSGTKVEVSEGYIVNGPVTVTAVYDNVDAPNMYKVTFIVDGQVFQEIEVEDGQKPAQIPIPNAIDGYTFVGWFNGENRLTSDTIIQSNIEYTARYDRSAYRVTFKLLDQTIADQYIPIGSSLSADDIPQDSATMQNEVFMGWYDGDVKATVGLNVEKDMRFSAFIVSKEDYEGEWVDPVKRLLIKITDSQLTICAYDPVTASEDDIQFNINSSTYNVMGKQVDLEAGSLSYFNDYDTCWKFEVMPTGELQGVNVAYKTSEADSDSEGYISRDYRFIKCEKGSFVAGVYSFDEYTSLTVKDNGVVTNINDNEVFYGYFYKQEAGYLLEYKLNSYNTFITKINVTVDDMGNLLFDGKKIYIKDATAITEYNSDKDVKLRIYSRSDGTIYVVETDETSYYAQLEGDIQDKNFFLTYNGIRRIAKIENGSLVMSEGDYGTFTGVDGELVFDGFGGCTKNGAEIEYEFNPLTLTCYIDSKTYKLDPDSGTYIVITAADKLKNSMYRYDYSSYAHLEITFDGFGRMEITDVGSIVFGNYKGYYSLASETITLSSDCGDLNNGIYSITNDGNVFQCGFAALIKDGYTVQSHVEQFFGYWQGEGKDYIRVFYDENYGQYFMSVPNESDTRLTPNFDGSILYNEDYDCYITMKGNQLQLDYKNAVKLYTYFGEFEPFAGFDYMYIGSWTTGEGMRFEISEFEVLINDEAVTKLRKNNYNEYEFEFEGEGYKLYLDAYNQPVFEGENIYECKKLLYSVPDKTVDIDGSYIGDYSGEYDETHVRLVITENSIILNGVSPTHINVLGENTYGDYSAISFYMESGDFAGNDIMFIIGSDISLRLVRSSKYIDLVSPLSLFNGKYLYDGESISFDGRGNVVYFDKNDEHSAKYTVEDSKAYFAIGELNFVCENQDSKHILVSIKGNGNDRSIVFEVEKIELVGTYSGEQNNGWKWSFTFDGEGNVSVVCEQQETYNETVTCSVSVNDNGEIVAEFYLNEFYESITCKLIDDILYVTGSYNSFTECPFTKA